MNFKAKRSSFSRTFSLFTLDGYGKVVLALGITTGFINLTTEELDIYGEIPEWYDLRLPSVAAGNTEFPCLYNLLALLARRGSWKWRCHVVREVEAYQYLSIPEYKHREIATGSGKRSHCKMYQVGEAPRIHDVDMLGEDSLNRSKPQTKRKGGKEKLIDEFSIEGHPMFEMELEGVASSSHYPGQICPPRERKRVVLWACGPLCHVIEETVVYGQELVNPCFGSQKFACACVSGTTIAFLVSPRWSLEQLCHLVRLSAIRSLWKCSIMIQRNCCCSDVLLRALVIDYVPITSLQY
ncbi:hypothetical protein Tco_1292446 [Tanacetum coccineum]